MSINSYKKRLKRPSFEEISGMMVITVVESLTLSRPTINSIYVGKEWICEVFDTTTAYSSGISLSAPFRLSTNDLDGTPQIFKTTSLFPQPGYDFSNSPEGTATYFKCKSLNQTVAMDAALQYRYDTGSHKLRLTGLSSSSEITSIGDILSAGEYLVVIHRVPVANINYIIVI